MEMVGWRVWSLGGVSFFILAAVAMTFVVSHQPKLLSHSASPLTQVKKLLSLPIAGNKELMAVSATPFFPAVSANFKALWFTDYEGDTVRAVNRAGQTIWEQHFTFPSVPDSGQPSNVEFMTVAPNGNPMVTTANGMLVEEIDRTTHQVLWHYGVLNQQYCNNCLHQPKKAYLFNNGTEVLVTDANNRRVVIINKATNQIVWEYGHKAEMRDALGYLKGNRFAMPLGDQGSRILISDTLTKRIMIVDRATKNIIWQWQKPDSQWLQNVFPTPDGSLVAEDHLKNEVFEVNHDGQIVWTLHTLANGQTLKYPTDAIPLDNGDVLISEAGRSRIIEVNPQTKVIMWELSRAGFVSSMAIE